MKAVEDDDLDSYIESLKVGNSLDTLTRARMKKRTVEIDNELIKFEKMLNICKPSSFDVNKWKSEVSNQLETVQNISELEIKKKKQEIVKIESIPEIKSELVVDVKAANTNTDSESLSKSIIKKTNKTLAAPSPKRFWSLAKKHFNSKSTNRIYLHYLKKSNADFSNEFYFI